MEKNSKSEPNPCQGLAHKNKFFFGAPWTPFRVVFLACVRTVFLCENADLNVFSSCHPFRVVRKARVYRDVLVVAAVEGCRHVLMLKISIGPSQEGKLRKWRFKNELKNETVFWSRKWVASMRADSAASSLVVPILCPDSGHVFWTKARYQKRALTWAQFCDHVLGTTMEPQL